MKATVLRLGHRLSRDKRVSTHVGLVARAFGAREIIFDAPAKDVEESISEVVSAWGGDFRVSFTQEWRKTIRDFEGVSAHLTMYGMPLDKTVGEVKEKNKDVLVVVGGAKVPADVYDIVDYNISVGGQPHSEVAALAVFLDRFFEGREFHAEFPGGKKIIPQARGKKVEG